MNLKKEIKQKINDKVLYNNLKAFSSSYKQKRNAVYSELNFESLRQKINQSRSRTRQEILDRFEEFKKNVEGENVFIYQAKNASDACEYIASVCKKHDSEYVVKSKSMTSEEIRLNKYLEAQGIKPIETDLGEWILQLAKENPSHMVVPAIHKSRQQVAKIFRELTNQEIDENDIEKMVKIARHFLREYYFKAKVGITGANLAIAQNGTIGIVTNEGNARLTSTVPAVHIVLLGYEKLVKDFKEAIDIIRLLPKSATGQNISTYVSWIKASNPSNKNLSGKKEVHYVFLNNGRLDLFDQPIYKEASKCIRCGACANVCPSYEMVGGHVFGYIYTGPIGLINTAFYFSEEKAKELLNLCIGCRACSNYCPAGIDIEKLISMLRVNLVEKFNQAPIKKFSDFALSQPLLMKKTFSVLTSIQNMFVKGERIENLPGDLDFRSLPKISDKTFSEQFNENFFNKQKCPRRVVFYPGCAIEYVYPKLGIHLVKILNGIGFSVDIPNKSVCCGFPALHDGDSKIAKKTIAKNLENLNLSDDHEALLVLCPTCGGSIKDHFKKLTENNLYLYKKANLAYLKVLSFGEFLLNQNIKVAVKNNLKITYHVPCHESRSMHFSIEPYLKEIFGGSFIPLRDANVCCGFGGSFSFNYPLISKGILDKKVENIVESKADIVLTNCPGCVMQIEGGIKKKGLDIKVMHLAAFFDQYVDIQKLDSNYGIIKEAESIIID